MLIKVATNSKCYGVEVRYVAQNAKLSCCAGWVSVSGVKQTFLSVMTQGKVLRSLFLWRSANPASSWKPCKEPTCGSTEHLYTGRTCWRKEREGVNKEETWDWWKEKRFINWRGWSPEPGRVTWAEGGGSQLLLFSCGCTNPNTPIKGWGWASAVIGQWKILKSLFQPVFCFIQWERRPTLRVLSPQSSWSLCNPS